MKRIWKNPKIWLDESGDFADANGLAFWFRAQGMLCVCVCVGVRVPFSLLEISSVGFDSIYP